MNRLFVLFILLALSGCSVTQQLMTEEPPSLAIKHPDMRLYIDDGTGGGYLGYDYDWKTIDHLKNSNNFNSINEVNAPYLVEIFLSTKNNREPNILYAILQAATLFILPSKQDMTFSIYIEVTSPTGVNVYKYQDRRTWTASLLNPDSFSSQFDVKQRFSAVNNMLNHFLLDLRTSTPFAPKDEVTVHPNNAI